MLSDLATGFAHDLNQPLAAIAAYAEARPPCSAAIPAHAPQALDIVQAIASQALRAGDVVQQLRVAARPLPQTDQALDPNALVRTVSPCSSHSPPSRRSRLGVELRTPAPPSWATPSRLQALLVLLFASALDTVIRLPAERRKVTISTEDDGLHGGAFRHRAGRHPFPGASAPGGSAEPAGRPADQWTDERPDREQQPAAVTTVFVVDDDDGVRTSLGILLDSGRLPAGALCVGRGFPRPVRSRPVPGCLLLDMRMPGMSGMELLQELARRGAFLPVIFITGHGDVPMAVEAMKAGAFDFLQKPFSPRDLLDRIARALAADTEARQALSLTDELRRRQATLTPREKEVMGLIVAGHANKVIAMDLGLSERTVEIHRARVMEKMATRSVAHLVRMALALEEAGHHPPLLVQHRPPAG